MRNECDATSGDRVIGVKEARPILGVSREAIYKHVDELPHFRVGRRVLFRERDLIAWRDSQIRGGPA